MRHSEASVESKPRSAKSSIREEGPVYRASELQDPQAGSEEVDDETFLLPLPLLTYGDCDAFLFVSSNNLATLLSALVACASIKLSDHILYGSIVPGFGIAMVVGSLYYWVQGNVKAHMTGRRDITCQPFGVNTPGVFPFIYTIMAAAVADNPDDMDRVYHIGLACNFVQGLIETLMAGLGPIIMEKVPVLALLTSLSGVGFAWLGIAILAGLLVNPTVAIPCIFIILAAYFGGLKFGGFPPVLLSMLVGSAIAWINGLNTASAVADAADALEWTGPQFYGVEIFNNLGEVVQYTGTVLPIAVSVALSTIQCVYMAHNAGDDFDVRMSMLGDGTVTMIAALFGSPFGMTVFIGHPALKEGKAQGGYLLLTSAFFGVISFCGFSKLILTLVSIDSLNPVLLFVGAVVCCDTLSTTPIRHYPAFIIGLMPSLCDWASELGPAADVLHNGTVVYAVQPAMAGVLLLKGGAMLVSVMWTASLVCMIDRLYLQMAFWTALAALLSLVGLVHNDKMGWYTASHDKGWRFAVGYGSIALSALAFKLLQMRGILDSPYTDDVEEEDLDVKVKQRDLWMRNMRLI